MLLEYLEKLSDCQRADEAWALLVEQMRAFEIDRVIYGFTSTRTPRSFGDREDFLLLTNHPEEFVRKFVDEGMYRDAPMVKWAAENVGACSWGWIEKNYDHLTKTEQRIMDFNRKMGIYAGYSVSFKNISSRAKGAVGLVARRGITQDQLDDIWAEHGRTIIQMNNYTHLKITNLPFNTQRQPLTLRQREALEWVGDGKTIQDIATIMGLTPPTVEKHLRLARKALDAETTAQAVLKASFQNQIYVLPD